MLVFTTAGLGSTATVVCTKFAFHIAKKHGKLCEKTLVVMSTELLNAEISNDVSAGFS